MNKYLFSIIIPTFNCENFISRTLDSIIIQHEPNLEVIICDDSSTDKTKTIVDKYTNKLNINYFKRPAGQYTKHCPANTRREGLKRAQGKWVIFLDHDDILPRTAFRDIRKILKSGSGKEVFIEGRYSILYENGQVQQADRNITRLQGKIYNRAFLNKYNITFAADQIGDEDLYFNSLVYGHLMGTELQILTTDTILQIWRYRSDSFSQSFVKKKRNYLQTYFENYIFANLDGWLYCYNLYPSKKQYFLERIIASLLYFYFYYQGFLFKHGKDDQLPQNFIYITQAYKKICKVFNFTKEDVIAEIYKNPEIFNKVRENTYLPDTGYIIEQQTFKEFINQLEDKKGEG